MTHATAAPAAATISDRFLADNDIRIAERHRGHFAWLVQHFGPPVVWNGGRHIPDKARLIVLTEPPTGPKADNLYRALDESCVVVIPYSENPAFDFLKSKLKDFGTIGASPQDGPHALWWGGLKWAQVLATCPKVQQPLIASCYPRDAGTDMVGPLKQSLASLGLEMVVEPVKTKEPGRLHGAEKAGFILDLWKSLNRPVLWVEPDGRFAVYPSLISKIEFDFAVHRWNRWEISTRTIGFGPGSAAGDLLRTWRELAYTYPKVWDGYVLDQAWSLVSAQIPLNTVWLPRSYHATRGEQGPRHTSVIIHDLEATLHDLGEEQGFPKALRPARRASRIGAPEASVVVTSDQDHHGAVSVILSDIQSVSAHDVAGAVDAIVGAFRNDPAGFSRLELSLCSWAQDVDAATAVARNADNRIIQLTPSKKPARDLFRRASRFNIVPFGGNALS